MAEESRLRYTVRFFRSAISESRLYFASKDPCRARLLSGTRAVLASILATLGCYITSWLCDVQFFSVIPGVIFAFLLNIFVKELDNRDRWKTLVWASVMALLTCLIAVIFHGYPFLARAYLVIGVFLFSAFQTVHPRIFGLYLTWFVLTCVGLYMNPSIHTLPTLSLSLIVGMIAVFISTSVVLPISRRQSLYAVCFAIKRLDAIIIDGSRCPSKVTSTQLRESSIRRYLNNVTLASEQAIAGFPADDRYTIRNHIYSFEHIAFEVAIHRRPMSARAADHERITALATTLHKSVDYAKTENPKPIAGDRPPILPRWRNAFQVSSAVLGAILVSLLSFPDRWYWAAVTAFAVSASSRSETLQKCVHRAVGTLIGAIFGLMFGGLFIGHIYVAVGIIMMLILLIHYFLGFHYGAAVACATFLVGTVYGAFGLSLSKIIFLRMDETVIGVGFALIFVFVFVKHTDACDDAGRGALIAMITLLKKIGENSSRRDHPDVLALFSQLDIQLAKLSAARTYDSVADFFFRAKKSKEAVDALHGLRHSLLRMLRTPHRNETFNTAIPSVYNMLASDIDEILQGKFRSVYEYTDFQVPEELATVVRESHTCLTRFGIAKSLLPFVSTDTFQPEEIRARTVS